MREVGKMFNISNFDNMYANIAIKVINNKIKLSTVKIERFYSNGIYDDIGYEKFLDTYKIFKDIDQQAKILLIAVLAAIITPQEAENKLKETVQEIEIKSKPKYGFKYPLSSKHKDLWKDVVKLPNVKQLEKLKNEKQKIHNR